MGELDQIVQSLEGQLGACSGEPVPLDGGITNRNFRITLGGSDYVLRRHGVDTGLLGIDRGSEREAGERAAELGIAPAVVAAVEGGLLTRFVDCEPLSPTELRERAGDLGAALGAFHRSGLQLRARFDVPKLLREWAATIEQRGGTPGAELRRTQEIAESIARAVSGDPELPCHNDLLPGNLLRERTSGQILIVDWEYAGMGDPWFDLGNLSVNNGFDEDDDARMLEAWEERTPDARARARLRLMRVLSDAREAAWGSVQKYLSALDFDFDGYADEHYERLFAAAAEPGFGEALAAL